MTASDERKISLDDAQAYRDGFQDGCTRERELQGKIEILENQLATRADVYGIPPGISSLVQTLAKAESRLKAIEFMSARVGESPEEQIRDIQRFAVNALKEIRGEK